MSSESSPLPTMSYKLIDLLSIYPIQENIVKYLKGKDLITLSSLGGEYLNCYYDCYKKLELDQYDESVYSMFRKIEKLTLKNENQTKIVPKEKLAVLVSLIVHSIREEIINLRECKRLESLTCKTLNNRINFLIHLKEMKFLDYNAQVPEEIINNFPNSLKRLNLNSGNISSFNISHLVNLTEIDCSCSSIIDAAINNFPVSLEKIKLYRCTEISHFNISHLVHLKEIDCSCSTITNAAINKLPVSLEKVKLYRCEAIYQINIFHPQLAQITLKISHLLNLKQIDCSCTAIETESINNFPISLEKVKLSRCTNVHQINISHLVNLKEIDCSHSSILDEAVNNFPVSLEKIQLSRCRNILNFNISHLIHLKEIDCSLNRITVAARNSFPGSLEILNLAKCDIVPNSRVDQPARLTSRGMRYAHRLHRF
uniref:Uncharacterized protein n=1 Tax=Cacopsylla melanoneura TaxID=428564 RepID=A0A8D9BVJ7_9HEMI